MADPDGSGQGTPGQDSAAQKRGFPLWVLIPVLGVAALLGVFAYQVATQKDMIDAGRDPGQQMPSALLGKPAPQFALQPLYEGEPGFSTEDLTGDGVKLVNVWASWCVPCRAEHPVLEALAAQGVTIHGINYKDQGADARNFLNELGNPYALIGADTTGRTIIEWGSFGVPETFIIDANGMIRYRHIGPISERDIERVILPEIEKAKTQATSG